MVHGLGQAAGAQAGCCSGAGWTNELVCLLLLPVDVQVKARNTWWHGKLVDWYLLSLKRESWQ